MLKPFARIELPGFDASSASGAEPANASATAAPGADNGATSTAATSTETMTRPLPSVQVERRADDPLAALKRFLATAGTRVLICAESPGRRETMQQYLAEYGLRIPSQDDWTAAGAPVALVVSPLHAGFDFAAAGLAFVTEAELYAGVVRRGRRDAARRSNVDAMLRDLSEVRIGDPVVHEQHGIGRYLGLVTLDTGEGATEFLQLEYADADKDAVARFAKEIAPLVTSGAQGTTGYAAGRPKVSPVFGYWPCLIDKAAVRLETDVLTVRKV